MCIAHRLLHSTSEISDATASMPSPVISLCNIVLHLLVRHTALLRRLSSHSAHSTHFPFSNRFLEVPIRITRGCLVSAMTIHSVGKFITLLNGKTLEIVDYSPEIDKYLHIVCFPIFKGRCGSFCLIYLKRVFRSKRQSAKER